MTKLEKCFRHINEHSKCNRLEFHILTSVRQNVCCLHLIFHFILIYLCRVKYAAIEADLYTTLPKQKLNNLIRVI